MELMRADDKELVHLYHQAVGEQNQQLCDRIRQEVQRRIRFDLLDSQLVYTTFGL